MISDISPIFKTQNVTWNLGNMNEIEFQCLKMEIESRIRPSFEYLQFVTAS